MPEHTEAAPAGSADAAGPRGISVLSISVFLGTLSMYSRASTYSRSRVMSVRTLGWLGVALMLAMALLPSAGVRSAFAAEPVAVYNSLNEPSLEGNPTCAVYDATFGGGQDWMEVKKDPAGNGIITVPGYGTITVSNFDND